MRTLLTLLLCAVACFGQDCPTCGKVAAQKGEPSYASALRQAIGRRNLRWKVICDRDKRDGEADAYVAWAEPPGNPAFGYIEDGAKPQWITGGRTQREAAEKLTRLLAGPPNSFPQHKPPVKRTYKQCPPEIRGGDWESE